MRKESTIMRIGVLAVSFAVCLAGVWALSTPEAEGRRWVVWVSLAVLVVIAAVQTIRRIRK